MMFEAKESGRKEGIEIGKEQGEYNKSIQIAKNLISLGSDVDFYCKSYKFIYRTNSDIAKYSRLKYSVNLILSMAAVMRTLLPLGTLYNVPYKVDTARGRDCLKC